MDGMIGKAESKGFAIHGALKTLVNRYKKVDYEEVSP